LARESAAAAAQRWAKLRLVQAHYQDFNVFLTDVMALLGFSTTDLQRDMGDFLVNGGPTIMIQAQRGQAKTTIAAAFAVWSLIHSPNFRIVIVSAGESLANEISTLIIRVLTTMDTLECLRADPREGDRTSVEHYDVHYSLKGVDKSPSVACVGITSNLPGKRADILIADDIESPKNSLTAEQRARLTHLTLEFSSIATGQPDKGILPRIIWLGTPQSVDSVYNVLPGRGVLVRIWTGRYPTVEQAENYGDLLAPYLIQKMLANPGLQTGGGVLGDQGQPTDPQIASESTLQRKQNEEGLAQFQLQRMLNTKLSDAMRYPLKPAALVMMRLDASRVVPVSITPGFTKTHLQTIVSAGLSWQVNTPQAVSNETVQCPELIMYIDPAGGGLNGDENGYSVTGQINGNVFLFDWGGLPGGYNAAGMKALASVAARWRVAKVIIEKNFGYGAFKEVFAPVLQAIWKCAVDDDMVTGQKETRLINTLEPVLGRSSLIINQAIVEQDDAQCRVHGIQKAVTYSLFHQLARLTRDRGSLAHDDRLDAVEGGVRYWQALLAQDQSKVLEKLQRDAFIKQTRDPLGHNDEKSLASFLKRKAGILSRRLR
jgi:hypothetical protein